MTWACTSGNKNRDRFCVVCNNEKDTSTVWWCRPGFNPRSIIEPKFTFPEVGYPSLSGDFGLGSSGQGSGSGSDCSSSSSESSSNNNESDSSRLGCISGYEKPSFNPNSNFSGDSNSKGYNESNQRQGRL
ncbi:hypothetical protein G3M48_005267 [Beauveria asiatica]|uniref:Uncharacterized protein n=1 Tax=Beauveria asiatica TaxID=1069075 RepID=A0AAW0RS06_9HYPO